MHQELIDYITQALKHGLTEIETKQNLLNAGWGAAEIEESFVYSRAFENKNAPHGAQNPISTSEPTTTGSQNRIIPTDNATHFSSTIKEPGKKTFIIVLLFFFLLSLGTAFGYYQYFYNTPQKVLAKAYLGKNVLSYNSKFSFSYTEKISGSQNDKPDFKNPDKFELNLSGTNYIDNESAIKPNTKGNISLSMQYVGTPYVATLEYILHGTDYYLNLGGIPEIKKLITNKDTGWTKINIDELKSRIQESYLTNSSTSTDIYKNLKKSLTETWLSNKYIQPGDFLKKETLNEVSVFHLKPQINETELNKSLALSIQEALQIDGATQQQADAILELAKTIKIKELDVWIGQKDYQVYKIHLVTNAPSLSDLKQNFISELAPNLKESQTKARNVERLLNIKLLADALENYKKDHLGYPDGLNGMALNLTNGYIDTYPLAPLPSDGNCSDYFNTYWYTPEGKPVKKDGITTYPSYSLTFCLGNDTAGYKAGIAKQTPQGIQDNLKCWSTPENCSNTEQKTESNPTDTVKKLKFNAEFTFDLEFSDYNSKQEISLPKDYIDLMSQIK